MKIIPPFSYFSVSDFCENAKRLISFQTYPEPGTAGRDCNRRGVDVDFYISKNESTTGGLLFFLV
jgi:hypothetical protein